MKSYEKLDKIARVVRHFILMSTTNVGTGHPTSTKI
jgi:hypothetical protein